MKYKFLFSPCIVVLLALPSVINAQLINTIAGTGTSGFSGDSSLATLAALNNPFGIAVDVDGNVYFSDRHNNRIRKVFAMGDIITIAGNGVVGYNGDGIAGTAAELNDPNGVAIDSSGNIYFADRLNNRIRKINTAGIISTVAGNGILGFAGDNGPATLAKLGNPRGVNVDRYGNVYIADQGNNRIRKVDTTGIITTVAGTGTGGYNGDGFNATSAELYNPYGVATDTSGNIFIADVDNERIRKVAVDGLISTIAGTGSSGFMGDSGPATAAQLSEPIGIATDGAGGIFIADEYNACIREIYPSGVIVTVAGNGINGYNGDGIPAVVAELFNPTGVAIGSTGAIFIADNNNNRIRFTPKPTMVTTLQKYFSVKISPNPSMGVFAVNVYSTLTEKAIINIWDVTGRKLFETYTATNSQTSLALEEAGVYFIQVATPSETWHDKIVVAK